MIVVIVTSPQFIKLIFKSTVEEFSLSYLMTTASTIGISLISHGIGVYRFGPSQENGLHRCVKTGSNRTRNPLGNSTR